MRTHRIIVELAGGLGNQMFQYAFYLKMKTLGYNCSFYYDEAHRAHNGPELEAAFGLTLPMATKEELDSVLQKKQDLVSKLKRKVLRLKPSVYWEHDSGYKYKPEIFDQSRSIYLRGCWLSEKYFKDIHAEVREAFRFKPSEESLSYLEIIKQHELSVSIHIRRGDYLTSTKHKNLDYKWFVEDAIRAILTRIRGKGTTAMPVFFVFSDDVHHAFEVMRRVSEHFRVFFPERRKSFVDMQLMSACTHNIIANSTFSWWAAWLNPNPDKIVVSPDKWFTDEFLNDNDIVPKEWVKVAV